MHVAVRLCGPATGSLTKESLASAKEISDCKPWVAGQADKKTANFGL